jgi:protein TonB
MKKMLILSFTLSISVCISQGDNQGTIDLNKPVKDIVADTPSVSTIEKKVVVSMGAQYTGGEPAMAKFLRENLKYPKSAKDAGKGGTIYIVLSIAADGAIAEVKTLKATPACPECDEEALRVVKLMPPFVPALQDGIPVASYFNVPIKFTPR